MSSKLETNQVENIGYNYELPFEYLIVNPDNGGFGDLLNYGLTGDIASGIKFLESPQLGYLDQVAYAQRRVIVVSLLVRKILALFRTPLEWTGNLVEFVLNLLSENDNFLGLIRNLLHGKVVIPQRGSETYISVIGHIDGRINLYRVEAVLRELGESASSGRHLQLVLGNRALVDLCMMAAKLSYENAKVVRNVVDLHWKMHFVDFYDCWNDYQKQRSTHVFILCDKPVDANLILISFRGTEPFDADNWSTDFDISSYVIPDVGNVHMGFLEALGLGNRDKPVTFRRNLRLKARKFNHVNGVSVSRSPEARELNPNSAIDREASKVDSSSTLEGLDGTSEEILRLEMAETSAYFIVRSKLKSLLKEHKNAKFIVTGHSLGGALAILFPTVLVLHEEMEVMEKLLGVYTFGQPRVGDAEFHKYMEAHLNLPIPKYYRIVYCNDLVPRVPYDDKIMLYKHFGACLYYDSCYNEKKVDDEPNKNFFGLAFLIPDYLNAVWELISGLTIGYIYGPDYAEGWFSILYRVVGLALPGVSAHSPVNYVNSIRLGKGHDVQRSSFLREAYEVPKVRVQHNIKWCP